MTRITKTLASLFAGALLAFAAAAAAAATDQAATPPAAAAAAQETVDPATLRLVNRDVVTFRSSLSGVTPEQRVERARARIRALPPSALNEPIRAMPATLGDHRGVQFTIGDFLLFAVLDGDVDTENRQSFDALVKQTQGRLEEVRTAWHQLNDRPLLIQGLVHALVATAVLAVLVVGLHRGAGRLVAWMEKKRDIIAAVHPFVDWREFLARLAVGSMQLVRWLALIALGYAWLTYVLSSFVLTMPIAGTLGHWLWGKVVWLGDGVVSSLPGLATVFIVLAFTRAVVGVVRYFFDAVQHGRLRLPAFHPETATASRRIVTLVAWGLGFAVAYPYLPGSNSEAFKGLSVLFGLMITLGSAGLVTQAMGGLVVVYSRALRKGDFVDINAGDQGGQHPQRGDHDPELGGDFLADPQLLEAGGHAGHADHDQGDDRLRRAVAAGSRSADRRRAEDARHSCHADALRVPDRAVGLLRRVRAVRQHRPPARSHPGAVGAACQHPGRVQRGRCADHVAALLRAAGAGRDRAEGEVVRAAGRRLGLRRRGVGPGLSG